MGVKWGSGGDRVYTYTYNHRRSQSSYEGYKSNSPRKWSTIFVVALQCSGVNLCHHLHLAVGASSKAPATKGRILFFRFPFQKIFRMVFGIGPPNPPSTKVIHLIIPFARSHMKKTHHRKLRDSDFRSLHQLVRLIEVVKFAA